MPMLIVAIILIIFLTQRAENVEIWPVFEDIGQSLKELVSADLKQKSSPDLAKQIESKLAAALPEKVYLQQKAEIAADAEKLANAIGNHTSLVALAASFQSRVSAEQMFKAVFMSKEFAAKNKDFVG